MKSGFPPEPGELLKRLVSYFAFLISYGKHLSLRLSYHRISSPGESGDELFVSGDELQLIPGAAEFPL